MKEQPLLLFVIWLKDKYIEEIMMYLLSEIFNVNLNEINMEKVQNTTTVKKKKTTERHDIF